MILIYKIIVIFIFLLSNLTILIYGYGTTGAEILNLNNSARIIAMGNANAGLADDINAVIYNPAGLSHFKGLNLQLSRSLYFVDTGMTSLVIGHKIGKYGLGFKWKYFSTDDTYRNEVGYNKKDFKIIFSQYSLGIGTKLLKNHNIGATINVVSENYKLGSITEFGEDKSDSATSFDLGWLYSINKKHSLGAVLRNIGTTIKAGTKSTNLPFKLVIGGSHKLKKILVSWESFPVLIDTEKENLINYNLRGGVEIDLGTLKARCGLIYLTNIDITLGFGLPYKNCVFDYATYYQQDLGLAHRISLNVKL